MSSSRSEGAGEGSRERSVTISSRNSTLDVESAGEGGLGFLRGASECTSGSDCSSSRSYRGDKIGKQRGSRFSSFSGSS